MANPTAIPESRFDLSAFIDNARAELEAFAAATRAAQAEGEDGFVGDRFERRTTEDWWREFVAYRAYTEVEEELAHDRRQNGNVERRVTTRLGQRP